MKIIVLNGVARSGKDTLAHFIEDRHDGDVIHHSTVSTIKRMSYAFFGVDPHIKTNRERKLWSDLKDLWTEYCDGPYNEIVHRASVFASLELSGRLKNPIMICHIREPEEISKVVAMAPSHFGGKCITILVERPGVEIPDNHADQNVADFEYDIVLKNDGSIQDLANTAAYIIQNFIVGELK